MVEAFLHKGNLTHAEADCLESTIGDLAFGAYASAERVFALVGQLSQHGQAGSGDELPMMAELAETMRGLVHILDGSMHSCVSDRSLQLLSRAAKHLGNFTYVAGHLAANGVAIAEELSAAADAFGQSDARRFGRGIGGACRKVLLSNASSERLPEGPPSQEQLTNMSAGILQGFFGAGFELDISSDVRIITHPRTHVLSFKQELNGTGHNRSEGILTNTKEVTRLTIHINLHRCVSENLDLFQQVMSKAWLYFAEAEVVLKSPGQVMRSFLSVMLQGLPHMLARCGVEPQQQQMLFDAVRAMRRVQLRLRLPEDHEDVVVAAKDLRSAADHWSNMSWFACGNDLGRMLQGLALRAYPRQYVETDTGGLTQIAQLGSAVVDVSDEATQGLISGPTERLHHGLSPADLASGGFTSADQLGAGTGLSVYGVHMVEGIAEGLLHQRELPRAEAECLIESVSDIYDGASQMVANFVEVFEEMITSNGGMGQLPPAEQLGELVRSLDGVARIAEGFMTRCRSEAMEAFQRALEHLGSLKYITGRIMANGADVRDSIDLAVASVRSHDLLAFGRELGRILRKVLLSSQSKPVPPEGDVTLPQMVNVTAGVLEGFFGKGFELDISSDRRIATLPLPFALGDPDVAGQQQPEAKRLAIHIDLHECVKRNLPLFRAALTGSLRFFDSEDLELSPGGPILMEGLAELPEALQRCGVDEEQQQMLLESTQMLGSLHLALKVPHTDTAPVMDRAVELIKAGVSDWSRLQWFALGRDVGQMLREAVMVMHPELYTVDGLGTLRRRVLGLSDASPEVSPPAAASRGVLAAPALLAGVALAVAAALAARASVAARRRSPAAGLGAGSDSEDSEAGLAHAGALE